MTSLYFSGNCCTLTPLHASLLVTFSKSNYYYKIHYNPKIPTVKFTGYPDVCKVIQINITFKTYDHQNCINNHQQS